MNIVNINLNEMDNLMYPWQPLERGVDFASIVFCMTSLLGEKKIFAKYVDQLFVCLFVCQSPTGHNSKPIVMKLYQVVEVVSTEKAIVY